MEKLLPDINKVKKVTVLEQDEFDNPYFRENETAIIIEGKDAKTGDDTTIRVYITNDKLLELHKQLNEIRCPNCGGELMAEPARSENEPATRWWCECGYERTDYFCLVCNKPIDDTSCYKYNHKKAECCKNPECMEKFIERYGSLL